jgi:WD40 repeat protein
VFIWDLAKKELRLRLGRPLHAGTRAVLSPDGKTFAVATSYSQLHLWDVATGKELFTDVVSHDYWVRCLAFSPDGRLLASGGDLRQLRLWDTITWNLVRSIDGNAQALSFTPDGKQLAAVPFVPTNFAMHSSNAPNKPMSIWDVSSGKATATFPAQGNKVWWGAFADDGKRLVSFDGTMTIWDAANGRRFAQSAQLVADPWAFPKNAWLLGSPVLTPDGKTAILAITKDKGLRRITTALHAINLDNGKEQFVIPDVQGTIALAADGNLLASGGVMGIHLWDLAQRQEIRGLDPGLGRVFGVSVLAFSPNGRLLASAVGSPQPTGHGPDTADIRLWDMKTGKEIASFPASEGFVGSLAFSPDGNQLLSGMWNGSILVWDVAKYAGGLTP